MNNIQRINIKLFISTLLCLTITSNLFSAVIYNDVSVNESISYTKNCDRYFIRAEKTYEQYSKSYGGKKDVEDRSDINNMINIEKNMYDMCIKSNQLIIKRKILEKNKPSEVELRNLNLKKKIEHIKKNTNSIEVFER